MLPLYQALLSLYPAAYRCEYGEEMMEVLSEVQAEIRKQSILARVLCEMREAGGLLHGDRKSTRLNSSHVEISYAVFCLKKKSGIVDVLQHHTSRLRTL